MTLKAVLMQKLAEFWEKHPEINSILIRRDDEDFFPDRVTVEVRAGDFRCGATQCSPRDGIGTHYVASRLIADIEQRLRQAAVLAAAQAAEDAQYGTASKATN